MIWLVIDYWHAVHYVVHLMMGLLFTLQFGVLVLIVPKRIKDLAFIDDKLLENSQNCKK